ncbi:nucleotidyltransferase family protein [Virgibacillus sp. C22-A2]|uniref:Nucleotidyltransferase family protein n=1 Tax=Virgibacillus tibetensis TaxID=3042313 RepID=A0ABU6KEN2_9BACI|nr:nucleotidyltransferase family protein [Virgibacillus sp. C22-A2]
MEVKSEKDIIRIIQKDQWMVDILQAASTLDLPDWWICAGFVRSKIWDVLHGFDERTEMADIDVVYFDAENMDESIEKKLEERLYNLMPHIPWSVKNEARMHMRNGLEPYTSTRDAISKFPETATAFGVRLDDNDNVVLTAPHGVDDLLQMIVRPTPLFKESDLLMEIFMDRVNKKKWEFRWSMVRQSNE